MNSPFNYYYCPKRKVSWDDKFEDKYGECDIECSGCGKKYTPFRND